MTAARLSAPFLLIWSPMPPPHAMATSVRAVEATDADGTTFLVADNRNPAPYTQDFGDCLGASSINATRFDAVHY